MKKVYISPTVKEIFVDSESILDDLVSWSKTTNNPQSGNGGDVIQQDTQITTGGDNYGWNMNDDE